MMIETDMLDRFESEQVLEMLQTTQDEARSPLRTQEVRQGAHRRVSPDRRKAARSASDKDRRQAALDRRMSPGT